MSKSRGNAGAETLRSGHARGSLSAPACGRLPCRGCNIGCNGPSVPSRLLSLSRTMRRSGPLAAALLGRCSRAARRRASVRAVASVARPRSAGPGNPRELISRRRCERKATPPQPGTETYRLADVPSPLPRERSASACLQSASGRGYDIAGWRTRPSATRPVTRLLRYARPANLCPHGRGEASARLADPLPSMRSMAPP